MRIRVGYELVYSFEQPTPMLLTLSIHYSRASDIIITDHLTTEPYVPVTTYRDGFGNFCSRIVAPAGQIKIMSSGLVNDSGRPDVFAPDAPQIAVEDLPDDTLIFLRGSRYCETDLLSDIAWSQFSGLQRGWPLVQAICDFVHNRISFDYQKARATRSAWEAYNERVGVCRDYAHLAIAFCRCMNIPARYCTGYLGDMGTAPPYGVPDHAAWIEVYLGGEWYIFDPRNNVRRIGRILIARGRDAADVAIATTFGPNILENFTIWTDEVDERGAVIPPQPVQHPQTGAMSA
ncbi:MAG TPA: transglutaminase family protein [Candidatus Acidoferrales bacterium]|nr:transglutaminase family protein [Candidatus Acidoferrales bacterium]